MRLDHKKLTGKLDTTYREGDEIPVFDMAEGVENTSVISSAEKYSVSHFVHINEEYWFPSITKFYADDGSWQQLNRGLAVGSTIYHRTDGWIQVISVVEHITDKPVMCSFPLVETHRNLFRQDLLVHNGGGGGGGCFPATALVTMADGSKKAISTVRPGEMVQAYHQSRRRWMEVAVGGVLEVAGHRFIRVYFEDGTELFMTQGHPVLARSGGKNVGWYAGNLRQASKDNPALKINARLSRGCEVRTRGGWKKIRKTRFEYAGIAGNQSKPRVYTLIDTGPAHTFLVEDCVVHNKGGCVLAGTKISMGNGRSKRVENVKVGDKVRSYNEHTGDIENKLVKGVESPLQNGYYEVVGKSTTLKLTSEHPVCTRTPGGAQGWAAADPYNCKQSYPFLKNIRKIKEGDFIKTIKGWDVVQALNYVPGEIQTYNLWAIEQNRNYFANSMLVHNKGCFLAGTKIRMADGASKPVEEVVAGDVVESFNEATKRVEPQAVRGVESPVCPGYYDVQIASSKPLQVTGEHPLFIRWPDKVEGWGAIDAKLSKRSYPYMSISQITEGCSLYVSGSWVPLLSWEYVEGEIQTYNLWDVEQNNTYFADDALVHNKGGGGGGPGGGCFLPGTLVTLASGMHKPIESIRVGENILSIRNEGVRVRSIRALEMDEHFVLHCRDRSGRTTKLRLTGEHPIRAAQGNPARNQLKLEGWYSMYPSLTRKRGGKLRFARKLEVGVFVSSRTGWLELIRIDRLVGPVTVYDLINVGANHTFYADGIAVHNKCFLPGTKVTMASGCKKNIEDVCVGDEVKSWNNAQERAQDKRVLSVESPVADGYCRVEFTDDSAINLTACHPMLSQHGWTAVDTAKAEESHPHLEFSNQPLAKGTLLFGKSDYPKEVRSVEHIPGKIQTYNISGVEDLHTFFVEGLIAHNKCCFLPGTMITMADQSYKPIEKVTAGDEIKSFDYEQSGADAVVDRRVLCMTSPLREGYYRLYFLDESGDEQMVSITAEHPIMVEQGIGRSGWVAIDPEQTKEFYPYLAFVLKLDIGDKVFLDNGQFGMITRMLYIEGEIQTYNIATVENGDSFFADRILAHNRSCFLPGTLIEMANGDHTPIEKVAVGDEVITYDITQGKEVAHKVRGIESPVREGYYVVQARSSELHVTSEHPIYGRLNDEEGWFSVRPEDTSEYYPHLAETLPLEVGVELKSRYGWFPVTAVDYIEGRVQTHNLWDIEGTHTYFAEGFLVHNRSCFLAGTLISMADGTTKPIQNVKMGELVRSFNEDTGEVEDNRVDNIEAPLREGYYKMYFGDTGVINLTDEHPVAIIRDNEQLWAAIDPEQTKEFYPQIEGVVTIEEGDNVCGLNGALHEVTGWVYLEGEIQTYNLWGIENAHTYYAEGILVHNRSCFLPGTLVKMADGSDKPIEQVSLGDMVKAYDGGIVDRRVENVETPVREGYFVLKHGEGQELHVTDEHPIAVLRAGTMYWAAIAPEETKVFYPQLKKEITALLKTDVLVMYSGVSPISGWEYVEGEVQTYNIWGIEEAHTYYAGGVLVHNRSCFVPGTLISMADGSQKPIEQVRAGEEVKSFNECTGTVEDKKVLSIESPVREGYFRMELANGDVLKITDEHPVMTATGWAAINPEATAEYYPAMKNVRKLSLGDSIKSLTGEFIGIHDWEYVEGEVQTYNLWDIEDNHTYYANALLVHNRSCFLAGTPISMADGTAKPIQDVKVGDLVKSYDEEAKEVVHRRVDQVETPVREGYYNMYFGKNGVIKVTDEHPFYCKKANGSLKWCSILPEETKKAYPYLTDVGSLEVGDQIYTDQDTWLAVTEFYYVEGEIQTYNLWDIMDTHTYFAEGLLVHNRSCFLAGTLVTMADGSMRDIESVEVGELVWTYNEQSGEIENKSVLEVESPIREGYYNLKVEIGDSADTAPGKWDRVVEGTQWITKITNEHPLYARDAVDGTRRKGANWRSICPEKTAEYYPHLENVTQLEVGNEVYTDQGRWARVKEWNYVEGEIQTYNLRGIEDNPTYFANGLLAHNRLPPNPPPPPPPPPPPCPPCPPRPCCPGTPGEDGEDGDTTLCEEECGALPL